MSYRNSPDALVPMLAKCLVRHGSMEAIENYIRDFEKGGGDATVCPEFIATHEISRRSDREQMIAEAMTMADHVISASKAAKNPELLASADQHKTRKLPRILFGFFLSFLISLGVQFRISAKPMKSLPIPEQVAYAIPGSAIISLFSPTFFQCLSYPAMFYDAQQAKQEHDQEHVSGARAKSEGFIWGIVQGVAFYFPLLMRRKSLPAK